MKDDSQFAFAGLWDRWKPPQGPVIESCCILTTEPNELLRDVHDRMPVIPRHDKYYEWPTVSASELGRWIALMVPFEGGMMKGFPVGSLLNDPQNDVLECILEVPEFVSAQATLF